MKKFNMDPFSKRLIKRGSPFELQDAIVEGFPCRIFPHAPETLQDVFLRALSFARQEFIVNKDCRLSFGRALHAADQSAEILQNWYGVGRGKRVAILMNNTPEWAIAFMSIYFAGATAVALHAASDEQSLLKALKMSACSLILTDRYNVNRLEVFSEKYLLVLFPDARKFGNFLWGIREKQPGSIFPIFEPFGKTAKPKNKSRFNRILKPKPDDEALISFTSGSTGIPKAVVLSHRNLTTGLMNIMLGGTLVNYRNPVVRKENNSRRVIARPCSLLLSPFSHISGYSHLLLMCYLGGRIVLMSKWNKRQAATLIEKEEINSISGLSPMFINDILHINGSGDRLKSLKNLNIHGTALHHSFLRKIENKFPFLKIRTGYGMTETSGSISTASGNELLNYPGSSGPVLPSVEIRIVDHEGHDQSTGKSGEVWVRGSMVMKRYCADSHSTGIVLNNGWLKTGDTGHLDSRGYLYITDRLKDVIKCGDHLISTSKLEQLACRHSMVDEAVAIGLPASERRKRLILAVLPGSGIKYDKDDLRQKLSSHLKSIPCDIKIILLKSMPRTFSGKINRHALRQRIQSNF